MQEHYLAPTPGTLIPKYLPTTRCFRPLNRLIARVQNKEKLTENVTICPQVTIASQGQLVMLPASDEQ